MIVINTGNEMESNQFIKELSEILKEMNLDAGNVEKLVKDAAFEEWTHTFSSKMPLTSVSQIRQVRLFCLITKVFGSKLPSEFQIARLFHITPSSARTLLANTLASYKSELDKAFISSVKSLLESAEKLKDGYRIKIDSSYVVSQMNSMLRLNKPDCEQIKRLNESTSYFKISNSAREYFLD